MSIEDRLGNKAESWGSKEEPLVPGDQLIGKVIAVSEGETTYGPYPIIEVEVRKGTEGGKVIEPGTLKAWHVFATVAKNEVAKQKPEPDDDLGTNYIGTKKTKPGSMYSSYEDWHVLVEKATGPVDAPDWDSIGEVAKSEGADEFAKGTPPPFIDDDPSFNDQDTF